MTTSVGLLGLFAPQTGARESKMNDDNTLASFAGVLAGVNQANAKLIIPTAQADGAADGELFENAEDATAGGDATATDDVSDASAAIAAPGVDAAPTAAATTAIANSSAVNSSIAALNPALQAKLGRVISRMRQETGHDVQVTETYRSQSRQNALYAQGRETAGPVVTWTQSSKHTQGRAVDVTLDGGRASADAYTALQRIANEEGLRTLGAKDPGHLELPSKSAATVEQVPTDSGSAHVARVAMVAQVATVAQTASAHALRVRADSARISMPAAPGQQMFAQADGVVDTQLVARNADAPARIITGAEVTIGDATGSSGDDDSLIAQAADITTPPQTSSSRQAPNAFEISHLDRLSDAVNASRVESAPAKTQLDLTKAPTKSLQGAASMQFRAPSIGRSANNSQGFNSERRSSDGNGYGPMPLRVEPTTHFSVAEVATQMTSTASQRAERIMAAQDAPARPLSQIVMSIDAGNGTTDRIQVALRGSTVSATIDAADHHAADAMRIHSDDLVRSLTKDGVDVDSVRVRSTAPTASSTPVATADSSQKSSDSSNNSRFSREGQWDQQRSQQRSNNERRQHQREQRGGKES